ncbi:MAG: hypothetical protein ACEQSF_01335 [Solirubrobacteraceae bacterium]
MKKLNQVLLIILLVLYNSCSTKSKFPVSDVTPAANISVKKGKDTHSNYTIKIKIENLAAVKRLNPKGHNYSVWIVTKENLIKNVGQLNIVNAKKTTFYTTTPFDFNEVFITAEDKSDLNYPRGVEISRTKI